MRVIIATLAVLLSFAAHAQDAAYCYQVKVDTKHKLSLKKQEESIVKFKLTNCSGQDLLIDKNAATEYESPKAALFFKVYRCEEDCVPYAVKKQYYQKVSDTVPYIIRPGFSYTYEFPLFELYRIAEPGTYKLVGCYRRQVPGNDGQPVDYLVESEGVEITVTK